MKLKEYVNLAWPINLWSSVLRKRVTEQELPEDWEAALDHIFNERIDAKKAEIVLYYFRDGMTFQEIGNIYGLTLETIRQHASKAIRVMRHPSWRVFLIYGLEKGKMVLAEERAASEQRRLDSNSIETLDLSVRAYNCLRRAGIITVEQLAQCSDEELARLRNMGTRTLHEIKECLAVVRGESGGNENEEEKSTAGVISRKALIEAVENIDWYSVNSDGVLHEGAKDEDCAFVRYSEVDAAIKAAVSLPFVPDVRGQWLPRAVGSPDSKCYYCSNCKADVEASKTHYYKFCPECGAKMESVHNGVK